MSNYIISCCSTADLDPNFMKARDIHFVGCHYYLNDEEFIDDCGQTLPFSSFYQKMQEGVQTRTSQVNIEEFIDYFTGFLEAGQDILHLTLSGGISGVYNSAATAAELLRESYPERTILVLDSKAASTGYGMLVDAAADNRDAGMSLERNAAWLEEHKMQLQHWFTSEDLSFYVKGGRISKASGWFGTMLKICPLMNVDEEGHLGLRQKMRGRRASLNGLVTKMEEQVPNYAGKVFVSGAGCPEEVEEVASLVQSRFPKTKGKIVSGNIGYTIGSHTGPGTVALFFWGDERI